MAIKGETETWSEGCYFFTDNAKFGYIDTLVNEVIPPQYENASRFFGDYAKVQLNGKLGLINRSGNVTIPIDYDELEYGLWTKEYVVVKKKERYGVVSLTGNMLLECVYDKIIHYEVNNSLVELDGKRFYVENTGLAK